MSCQTVIRVKLKQKAGALIPVGLDLVECRKGACPQGMRCEPAFKGDQELGKSSKYIEQRFCVCQGDKTYTTACNALLEKVKNEVGVTVLKQVACPKLACDPNDRDKACMMAIFDKNDRLLGILEPEYIERRSTGAFQVYAVISFKCMPSSPSSTEPALH